MITLSQFSQMIPTNKEASEWYPIAVDFFKKYDITTINRIASFMAQTAHESNDYRNLEENLNYSVDNLKRVFPRYFKKTNPADYARNPEKLANYVYMDVNRTKSGALGNVKPGDGWRFRGGGIKQLTGRNNFTTFGKDIGMSPEEAADYVRTKEGAFESACWFWKKNSLHRFADADDIVGMSKKINGGNIGLEDRINRYKKAKAILSSSVKASSIASGSYSDIRRGSKGEIVKRVQHALKLSADGVFGLQTEIAVRSWQRINKYPSNGVLDNNQIKKILGE